MSDDPYVPFFLAIEEQMRASGYGAMVDRAQQNARADLLRALRAYLEYRRARDFERGILLERLAPAIHASAKMGLFVRFGPGGNEHQ
jgi:hypothetical protein